MKQNVVLSKVTELWCMYMYEILLQVFLKCTKMTCDCA